MADSIGIELDEVQGLGRAFQHQDLLLLVVKRNTFSISLIMPRFTYNGLPTKTVEVPITEACGVILWFWTRLAGFPIYETIYFQFSHV